MNTRWSDEIDDVLGGDLTAALAVATPGGGAVVTAIAPVGLRDRRHGTVTFLTSLGFSRKLDHIRAEPRVALAYHSRLHGGSRSDRFVLVQGVARIELHSPQAEIDRMLEQAGRVLGGAPAFAPRFWEWWMKEYVTVRVPVVVDVTTITTWPDLDCAGTPEIWHAPPPSRGAGPTRAADAADGPAAGKDTVGLSPARSQRPPTGGTHPRVPVAPAAARIDRMAHQLLGFLDAGGCPTIAPVVMHASSPHGFVLAGSGGLMPAGARRAGLLAHDYRPRLVGIRTVFFTGWLTASGSTAAVYSPHTRHGFSVPANKTVLLLANGLMAKVGLWRAVRAKEITEWPTPFRHSGATPDGSLHRGYRPRGRGRVRGRLRGRSVEPPMPAAPAGS